MASSPSFPDCVISGRSGARPSRGHRSPSAQEVVSKRPLHSLFWEQGTVASLSFFDRNLFLLTVRRPFRPVYTLQQALLGSARWVYGWIYSTGFLHIRWTHIFTFRVCLSYLVLDSGSVWTIDVVCVQLISSFENVNHYLTAAKWGLFDLWQIIACSLSTKLAYRH